MRSIEAPSFDALSTAVRALLDNASMQVVKPDDSDLAGVSGAGLYQKLGALRKACLLNIAKKASHGPTTDDCLRFVDGLLLCRQQRIFARVKPTMPEHLRRSQRFKSAPGALREPLPGFQLVEGSFKSRDAHANLQVTFMQDITTGALAADIDIDEASGIQHGFEAIRNSTFKTRTNLYLIREFMLSADPVGLSLSPGYRFVF